MVNSNTTTRPTIADAECAYSIALEHTDGVDLDGLRRLRRDRRARELSLPQLEKAAEGVQTRALRELQRMHPSAADSDLLAVLTAVLEPRGYAVLDPCQPGELMRPAFLHDGLFYESRAHELFGRPGTNKTALIVWGLATLASEEKHGLLIEYEMDANAIGTFLEEMGFDRQALRPYFHQVAPTEPWGAELLGRLMHDFPGCEAVALDNVAEAIQSFGGDENVAGDTLKALAPLRDLAHSPNGPAVITADHLPHSRENASRGTTAKGALIDVGYQVETPHPVTRDRAGDIKLTCRKDRPSMIGKGNEIWFSIGDGAGGLPIKRIETPGRITDELTEDGATMIVSLEQYGGWLSKEKVYDLCPFSKSRKRDDELERLANDPSQPIVRQVRQRGNAAAATQYRYQEVSADGLDVE